MSLPDQTYLTGVIVQVQRDLLLQHELMIQCYLQQQIYHLQLVCFEHSVSDLS